MKKTVLSLLAAVMATAFLMSWGGASVGTLFGTAPQISVSATRDSAE